jgi:hypothetical protein
MARRGSLPKGEPCSNAWRRTEAKTLRLRRTQQKRLARRCLRCRSRKSERSADANVASVAEKPVNARGRMHHKRGGGAQIVDSVTLRSTVSRPSGYFSQLFWETHPSLLVECAIRGRLTRPKSIVSDES